MSDSSPRWDSEIESAFRRYVDATYAGARPECGEFLDSVSDSARSRLEQMIEEFDGIRTGLHDVAVSTLEPGTRIGDFELDEKIGEGAMGVVWKARQLSLDRDVALKILRPELTLSVRALERFQREAVAGGRLHHRGIVRVLAIGEVDGRHYMVQDLVPGGRTLADQLTEERDCLVVTHGRYRGVAEMFVEATEALAHAHENGVLHRDVKPSNLLVDSDGSVHVADFGLAALDDDLALTRTGEFLGTPYYMSPEQAAAKRMGLDHRTDVFSLGATLYEALTLVRAFEGDTSQQVLHKILTVDPPDPRTIRSRLPHELAVICLKALEKSPDRRYASMAAFGDDLRRFLGNEPITARPPSRWRKVSKWCVRHPALASAGALGSFASAVILFLLILNLRTQETLASTSHELELFSTMGEVRDLLRRADEDLWPVHPSRISAYEQWIARAERCVAEGNRLREELQGPAADRTDVSPTAEEERQLRSIERRLATYDAALRRLRGEDVRVDAPEIDPVLIEEDPQSLLTLARSLVGVSGYGAEALQFAERVLWNAEERDEVSALDAVARAYLALGCVDDAREAARAHLDLSGSSTVVNHIESRIAHLTSPDGLAQLEEVIETLRSEESLLRERRPSVASDGGEVEGLSERTSEVVRSFVAARLLSQGPSEEHGWDVEERLRLARALERDFGEQGVHDRKWRECLPRLLADYPGLELAPILGIVPLDRNPVTGLWEFWHVLSGDRPERVDGRFVVNEETGIVLALLPAGSFLMGAQGRDPAAANFDDEATDTQMLLRRVTLDPFFLAIHEMTQSQWRRLFGRNPSYHRLGRFMGQPTVGLTNPVDNVTWRDADRCMAWLGLDLPSQAQWEYACRAGSTDSRFFPLDQVREYANLAGAQDGFEWTAPVCSLKPNEYGLHDMLGNVGEWCSDMIGNSQHPLELEPGTGRAVVYGRARENRIIRGGSIEAGPGAARAAGVTVKPAMNHSGYTGVRPALNLPHEAHD